MALGHCCFRTKLDHTAQQTAESRGAAVRMSVSCHHRTPLTLLQQITIFSIWITSYKAKIYLRCSRDFLQRIY